MAQTHVLKKDQLRAIHGGKVAKKPKPNINKVSTAAIDQFKAGNGGVPVDGPGGTLASDEERETNLDLGLGTIPPDYSTGSYLGPSAGEDPYLAKFMPDADENGTIHFVTNGLRRVTPEVVFTVHSRECQCDAAYRKLLRSQWDSINKVVAPFRDQLLALYFKFIDWTYPAVDKKRFYRSYYHHDPPMNRGLLAAMLALGSTYWKYNPQLCIKAIPPRLVTDLWAVSLQYIDHDINCQGTSLDVVQALLLYVQKRLTSDGLHEGIVQRLHIGKLVSMAFALGLHIDCSNWQISDIEKVSRRRLWALVYFVDKWSAANLGHPSLLTNLATSDPKQFKSEWRQERRFVHLVQLTSILSEVLDEFYAPFGRRPDHTAAQMYRDETVAHQLLRRLRAWRAQLPEDISDIRARNSLRYCSNGNIHLAALAIEVLIYRVLLKESFMGRYRHEARGLVQRIITFTGEITHSHLHAFWISSCVLSLSSLAHFVLLYHAQSPPVEQAQNASLVRSWLDCLRVLNHAWEEGIGITQHRMDALFHKGNTSIKVPIIDESMPQQPVDDSVPEANRDIYDVLNDHASSERGRGDSVNSGCSQPSAFFEERNFTEEPLGLEEDLLPIQVDDDASSPNMLLLTDNDLHDILAEYIWD